MNKYVLSKLENCSRPKQIIIEITENEDIEDFKLVKKFLVEVKKTGAKISNPKKIDKDDTLEWIDAVSEDVFFNKVDEVSEAQRHHGVFSGDRMNNCERCSKVTRDYSYPDGSPTGLICSRLNVFVTANGVCDEYSRH